MRQTGSQAISSVKVSKLTELVEGEDNFAEARKWCLALGIEELAHFVWAAYQILRQRKYAALLRPDKESGNHADGDADADALEERLRRIREFIPFELSGRAAAGAERLLCPAGPGGR
eukprot:587876-Rhodomonas_salina.2